MMDANKLKHLEATGEALTDARRLRDILTGAAALLMREVPTGETVTAARCSLLEARALADGQLQRLEQFFAWLHEAERHATQAAR